MLKYKQYPLWPKQREALDFLKKRGDKGAALFIEMGLGKTRIIIHWLAWLFSQGMTLTYIVAPLSVLHVWVENWHDWAKYPITFIDLHELGSEGLRLARELSAHGYPVICLVNYEKSWQIGHKYVERVITKGTRKGETVKEFKVVDTTMDDLDWDIGILDESTAIKNRGSRTSQFWRKQMRQKTRYRAILTGSAYTKRPLDVWAQIMYACRDEVFSPRFEEFAARYAIPHPEFRGQYVGYCNLDDFTRRLSKVAYLLKKEECGADLPPVVHQTRHVTLCPRSRKLYDEIKEEMYAEFEALEREHEAAYAALEQRYKDAEDDSEAETIWQQMEELKRTVAVTAEHVFARSTKLKQITSGFIIPDSEDAKAAPVRLGTEKVSALIDVLEERIGKATVIVVQADEEEIIVSEALEKKYGFKPKVLNGSVKGAQRRHDMIASAANDPYFIVKESVGCRGVDMRWTDCIVFYSHRPMTEAYEQMMARNHRGGVKELYGWESITYVHLLCKNTYDIKVMNILKNDLNLAREIERNWRALFQNDQELY